MLLPDRNMPPPGSPPPKTPAELVQAIQRFGMLATDARHAEVARLFQGMAVVASMSDAALAQRNLELEGRVAELERRLAGPSAFCEEKLTDEAGAVVAICRSPAGHGGGHVMHKVVAPVAPRSPMDTVTPAEDAAT